MMASDLLYVAACICLLGALGFIAFVIWDLRQQDKAARRRAQRRAMRSEWMAGLPPEPRA
jgi:hypothetical protein